MDQLNEFVALLRPDLSLDLVRSVVGQVVDLGAELPVEAFHVWPVAIKSLILWLRVVGSEGVHPFGVIPAKEE